MTQDSVPITPPPELVEQWCHKWTIANGDFGPYLATQAARWGADQELLACGKYLERCAAWEEEDVTEMYNYRRPRPLSLKEQALETVQRLSKNGFPCNYQDDADWDTIRRALEALPE